MNEKRRAHQIQVLQDQLTRLQNEARFVERVIQEPTFLLQQKRADIMARLEADGVAQVDAAYHYLLRVPADAFTDDTLVKMRGQLQATRDDLELWRAKTACDIWADDLARFEKSYREFLVRRLERRQGPDAPTRKRPAATAAKKPRKEKRAKTGALVTPEFQFI